MDQFLGVTLALVILLLVLLVLYWTQGATNNNNNHNSHHGSGLTLTKGCLTSAQILTLGTVGFTLLPAKPGRTYLIAGFNLNYVYGTTAYTVDGSYLILSNGVAGAATNQVAQGNTEAGFLDQVVNERMMFSGLFTTNTITTTANQALLLTNDSGVNPTLGNGTLTYSLLYAVVPCP